MSNEKEDMLSRKVHWPNAWCEITVVNLPAIDLRVSTDPRGLRGAGWGTGEVEREIAQQKSSIWGGYVFVSVCVCVPVGGCLWVWVRERQRQRDRKTEGRRERERVVCVCVYVCVCVCAFGCG